jgi:uncharacterized membrane protein YsdA (DUF1294 family)
MAIRPANSTSRASGREAGASQLEDGSAAVRFQFPVWLKLAFWVCMVIAVAAVLRRAVALVTPAGRGAPPQLASLDAWFGAHALLTWTHIVCALALVALLPFIFRDRAGDRRSLRRAFYFLGGATGATAYAMSVHAVGGRLERSAVLVFNTAFLALLAMAYACMRRDDQAQERRWMIRAVAILLGIATTRPVMGVFFATARISHLTPHQFFGIAFWIGFSFNAMVIELWLRKSAAERIHA